MQIINIALFFLQSSVNIEGLTEEKIIEQLLKFMDMKNIQPISKEREIFGEVLSDDLLKYKFRFLNIINK